MNDVCAHVHVFIQLRHELGFAPVLHMDPYMCL